MRCPNGSQLIYCSRPLLIINFIVRLALQHAYYYYNILYYILVYAQLFILSRSSRACIVSGSLCPRRRWPIITIALSVLRLQFFFLHSGSYYIVNKENRRRPAVYLMCVGTYYTFYPAASYDIHRPICTRVCDSSADAESLSDFFCWFWSLYQKWK